MVLLKPVVKGWKQVMLHLGVPMEVIECAEMEHRGVQDQKTATIDWWMKNDEDASWKQLAKALEKGDHKKLSMKAWDMGMHNHNS